jgi:ArsR family transcriptional regulator
MRDVMTVLKALADENRVRALMALAGGELCVCQIVELLGLATSTVSKHMAILRHARLVQSRRDGRWIYYRLATDDATPEAEQIAALLAKLLADNPRIGDDARRLKQITCQPAVQLCRNLSACE